MQRLWCAVVLGYAVAGIVQTEDPPDDVLVIAEFSNGK